MTGGHWRKVWRDAAAAPGRLSMIVAALATSLASVMAMLTAYTVLRREVPRSFLAANPASARLTLNGSVADATLREVRARPDVLAADIATRQSAQMRLADGESLPVLFFVSPDISPSRVDAVYRDSSLTLAPDGLYIERSALALTHAAVGDSITLLLPVGGVRRVRIAGTVHDPAVAPAWQEQLIYAYATPRTMQALGETPVLDQLKFIARDTAASAADVEAIARAVRRTVEQSGQRVWSTQVPPVRQHPHQTQMNAIVTMLLVFSLLGMLLGAMLTATVIGGLLAEQVRQIAIMKAIGARTAQLAAMYLGLTGVLGAVAVLLAIPSGWLAGRALVSATAALLNLRVESLSLPWWIVALTVVLGIAVPMLATSVPVWRATRRSVRDAMDDAGGRAPGDTGPLMQFVARAPLGDVSLTLAARNAIRRGGRLATTAGLLAGAGAMCLASLDLRAAWEDRVASAARDRHFEVEVQLREPIADSALAVLVHTMPGVTAAENWSATGATRETTGEDDDIGHAHADGGHGALTVRAAPPGTHLIAHRMSAGRWLLPNDSDAVVLNTMARKQLFADVHVGDAVTLRVRGELRTLQVVGFMDEALTPSTAFVTPRTFAEYTGSEGRASSVRLQLNVTAPDSVQARIPAITRAFEQRGYTVRRVLSSGRMAAAQGGHVYILVLTLALLALAMAVTGLIGLTAALGMSVVERTREFGVMRALGATRLMIVRSVVLEGVVMAVISLLPAALVSRLLSGVVGGVLARIAQQDLRLVLSYPGMLSWSLFLLSAAAAVSAVPAARAANLTVRDAIAHT